MIPVLREALLLILIGAAAFVAALSLRVAVHPGETHAPRFMRAFEAARETLPALGAVRVRSSDPDAAHRLATARGGGFARIIDPARARRAFQQGRLLFATPERIRETRTLVERGQLPPPLPTAPDLRRFFHDRRGGYSCDVVVEGTDDLDRIRTILPDAELLGEPVVAEREAERRAGIVRALLAGVAAAAAGTLLLIRRRVESSRRLLAGIVPLALLGLTGLGLDAPAVCAIFVVIAAPAGAPLVAGAAALFFPELALRRLGVVFLTGALLRWRKNDPARGEEARALPPPEATARQLAAIPAVLAAAALYALPLDAAVPPELAGEAAVVLVAPAEAAATAARLRAEGHSWVSGAPIDLPPEPEAPMRSTMIKIHHEATRLERHGPPEQRAAFAEVAEAASTASLYEPAELRARTRARDGRVALWVQGEVPLADESFQGAALARRRGERAHRRNARIATALGLLLATFFVARPDRRRLGRFWIGFATAAALLFAIETGVPMVAEAWLPVLLVATLAPHPILLAPLAAAAALAPGVCLFPAIALAAAVLIAR